MFKKIKALCADKKISIQRLEIELGFGNGTISRWDTNRPSVDKVKAVADYFGCKVDDLLEE